jgi:hypothetical protein
MERKLRARSWRKEAREGGKMGRVERRSDWRDRSWVRGVRVERRVVVSCGVRDWRRVEREASIVSMTSSRTWMSNAVFSNRVMAWMRTSRGRLS